MTEEIKKTATSKAVYKTMVEPKPETIQYLTGWRRPTGAYILMETKELHVKNEGVREWGTGLCTVVAENRADVIHTVEAYLEKGFRILDYGNFPKLNDPSPKRASKARLYSGGGDDNPWDTLEKNLRIKMASDVNWREEKEQLLRERDVLLARVAAAETAKKAKTDKLGKEE